MHCQEDIRVSLKFKNKARISQPFFFLSPFENTYISGAPSKASKVERVNCSLEKPSAGEGPFCRVLLGS